MMMKSLLIVTVFLLSSALASPRPQKQVCEPGATFKMECNTCRCSLDGTMHACTKKQCIPEEVQQDDPKMSPNSGAVEESAREEEPTHAIRQVCTPNEAKMEDCNRCKCAANGIGWFCTKRACPPKKKRFVRSPAAGNEKCTPGTTFKDKDGCNDCTCTETGVAFCTLRACFSNDDLPKLQRTIRDTNVQPSPKVEKKCTPGSSFLHEDGCNTCFCTEKGEAACTLMACLSNDDVSKLRPVRDTAAQQPTNTVGKCVPGSQFMDEDNCNKCFCTEKGEAACTMMLCART